MDSIYLVEWLARERGNRTATDALAYALHSGQPPVRAHLNILLHNIGHWLLGQARKAADERRRIAHMRETRASR